MCKLAIRTGIVSCQFVNMFLMKFDIRHAALRLYLLFMKVRFYSTVCEST